MSNHTMICPACAGSRSQDDAWMQVVACAGCRGTGKLLDPLKAAEMAVHAAWNQLRDPECAQCSPGDASACSLCTQPLLEGVRVCSGCQAQAAGELIHYSGCRISSRDEGQAYDSKLHGALEPYLIAQLV